jgi:hypothetical protein
MLSYVEDEESYGGQVVLDEVMMFEEPSEGYANAAGDSRKAQWIERKGDEGHGSHQLRPVNSNALKRKTRSFQ